MLFLKIVFIYSCSKSFSTKNPFKNYFSGDMKKILITGGAGFIGSHLADALIEKGYEVRVLDNLLEQVHGANCIRPPYLNTEVELIVGDVRDPYSVEQALSGIDAVFHFAAMVGVGQSMYEIRRYTDVNNNGTAILLEALIKNPISKLIVASSMSIYGEGLYKNRNGEITIPVQRKSSDMKRGKWEVNNSSNESLIPYPTPETKTPDLSSVYALSKFDQERLCMMIGKAYNVPTIALRFFNVYGTRQALSNPYTGVLAIFASRLLNNKPPIIFEDGLQKRDFVSVHDVAKACILAPEVKKAEGEVFNIGSGSSFSVMDIAEKMSRLLNKEFIKSDITGEYRIGDIRHCFADITKAKKILGYTPEVELEKGLSELTQWLEGQKAEDKVSKARAELNARGLTV
jgi:dTDP-L-rhamnose 4-epimerase